MKKLSLSICLVAIIFAVGCKKEETTPPLSQGPAPLSNSCTAMINGVNFTANSFSSGSSGSDFELRFENGDKEIYFSTYNSNIQVGTYPLQNLYNSTAVRASYGVGNSSYPVETGTINITQFELDTTGTFTEVRKFVATFNFMTDTIAGNHFNVTGGSAVYINNN